VESPGIGHGSETLSGAIGRRNATHVAAQVQDWQAFFATARSCFADTNHRYDADTPVRLGLHPVAGRRREAPHRAIRMIAPQLRRLPNDCRCSHCHEPRCGWAYPNGGFQCS